MSIYNLVIIIYVYIYVNLLFFSIKLFRDEIFSVSIYINMLLFSYLFPLFLIKKRFGYFTPKKFRRICSKKHPENLSIKKTSNAQT